MPAFETWKKREGQGPGLAACKACGGVPTFEELPGDWGYSKPKMRIRCADCGITSAMETVGEGGYEEAEAHLAKLWNGARGRRLVEARDLLRLFAGDRYDDHVEPFRVVLRRLTPEAARTAVQLAQEFLAAAVDVAEEGPGGAS